MNPPHLAASPGFQGAPQHHGTMEVMPTSVGRVSRAWDEQHLDLRAASHQIAAADGGGFSSEVRGTAVRFLSVWARHASNTADQCEAQADGLRSTIRDYLDTDVLVADYFTLSGYLLERR